MKNTNYVPQIASHISLLFLFFLLHYLVRALGLLPQAGDRMSQSSNETIKSFNKSVSQSVCQSVCQSVRQSVGESVNQSASLTVSRSVSDSVS